MMTQEEYVIRVEDIDLIADRVKRRAKSNPYHVSHTHVIKVVWWDAGGFATTRKGRKLNPGEKPKTIREYPIPPSLRLLGDSLDEDAYDDE